MYYGCGPYETACVFSERRLFTPAIEGTGTEIVNCCRAFVCTMQVLTEEKR